MATSYHSNHTPLPLVIITLIIQLYITRITPALHLVSRKNHNQLDGEVQNCGNSSALAVRFMEVADGCVSNEDVFDGLMQDC